MSRVGCSGGSGAEGKKAAASPKKAVVSKKVPLAKASDKSEEPVKSSEETGEKAADSSAEKPPAVEKSRITDATENSGPAAKAVEELSPHLPETESRQGDPAAPKQGGDMSTIAKGGPVEEESDKKATSKTATAVCKLLQQQWQQLASLLFCFIQCSVCVYIYIETIGLFMLDTES